MEYIFDIEADNLLENVTTVHCIVLRDAKDGHKVLTYTPDRIREGIEEMKKADRLVGHNIIDYDLRVLERLYGFTYEGEIFDTLVAARTVWPHVKEIDFKQKRIPPRLYGSHSLKAWGLRLRELKTEFDVDDFHTFTQEMLDYCVQDTMVNYRLYELIQSKDFSKEALDLEHKFHTLMIKQEEVGFPFDVDKAQDLYATLAQRKAEIEEQLVNTFEPTIVELKTKTKIIPFNPASRQQIADRLMARGWEPEQLTETGEPKVDEDTLKSCSIPEAALIVEYLMLNKRIGQLATGKNAWLKLQKNGRIHGRINHMGAVTGRTTASNPNMQQVPSIGAEYGRECRELFYAPEGYSLLGADASGLELRCLASYMAKYDGGAYVKDVLEGDIHTTNQKAAGLAERSQAKTFIYGFLYGAGDAKIGSIIGKGAAEGKKIKQKFLSKTPALKKLREAVSKAAERGWIKGLDGRQVPVRHPHASLNTLLQSAGALICKTWYVKIAEALEAQGYTPEQVTIVAFIHDEVQILVKQGLEEEIGQLVQQAMFDVREHFDFNCRLDSEYQYGRNWADTH